MSQNNQFDVGPLTWVKGEIEAALNAARDRLAEIQTDPQRREPLRFAQTHIHQASGALSIVGLDGVSQYADAIDKLLSALALGDAVPAPDSLALVQRCIGMLGNYLNELVAGAPHHALRLYPSYKELVAARGGEEPQPSELFFPDISVRPQLTQTTAVEPERAALELRVMRGRFEKGLLNWLRKPTETAGPEEMLRAVRRIEQIQASPATRAFWWAAIAFFEGLAQQEIPSNRATQRLCRRIDAQMRRLLEGSQVVAERLVRDVLYFVATSNVHTTHAQRVRDTYQLEQALPSAEEELSDALRQPIAAKVRETLEQAKEAWNRFCAGAAVALPQFHDLHNELRTCVAQMKVPQLDRLLAASNELLGWLRADPLRLTEPLSMEVATALLVVEQAAEAPNADNQLLRRQVDLLNAQFAARAQGETPPPLDDQPFGEATRRAQDRLFFNQLAREIQTNLGQIEQTLDSFFRNPAQRDALNGLGGPLKQIQGAFSMLGEVQAAQLISTSAARVNRLAAADTPPDQDECSELAHHLSAVGFFVEALRNGPALLDDYLYPNREKIAEPEPAPASVTVETQIKREARETQQLVDALKEAPEDTFLRQALMTSLEAIREDAQLIADSSLEQSAKEALASLKSGEAPQERITEVLAEVAPSTPQPSAEAARLMSVSTEELDAELLAIFLEEAHEVLDTIGEHRDLCARETHNHAALTTVRRGYHTLKGSSRMVGLQDFSEAARHVEMTMNRWLQLEKDVNADILSLIDAGRTLFTDWVIQLEAGGTPWRDASALIAQAQMLLAALDGPDEDAAPIAIPVGAVPAAATVAVSALAAATVEAPGTIDAPLAVAADEGSAAEELEDDLALAVLDDVLPDAPAEVELDLAKTEFDGNALHMLAEEFVPAEETTTVELAPAGEQPETPASEDDPDEIELDLTETLFESGLDFEVEAFPMQGDTAVPKTAQPVMAKAPETDVGAEDSIEFDLAATLLEGDSLFREEQEVRPVELTSLGLGDLDFDLDQELGLKTEAPEIDLSATVLESDFMLPGLHEPASLILEKDEQSLETLAVADPKDATFVDLSATMLEGDFALAGLHDAGEDVAVLEAEPVPADSEPEIATFDLEASSAHFDIELGALEREATADDTGADGAVVVEELEVDLTSTDLGGYGLLEPNEPPIDLVAEQESAEVLLEPLDIVTPDEVRDIAPAQEVPAVTESAVGTDAPSATEMLPTDEASLPVNAIAESAADAPVLEELKPAAELVAPERLEVIAIEDEELEELDEALPFMSFDKLDEIANPPTAPTEDNLPSLAAIEAAEAAETAEIAESAQAEDTEDQDIVLGDQTLSRGLYELYVAESRQHLDFLFDEHDRLAANPLSMPSIDAIRAAHTLAGISGTARVEAAYALGKALEHALHRYADVNRAPDEVAVAVFGSAIVTLDAMLGEVQRHQLPLEVPELIGQLQALRPVYGEEIAPIPTEPAQSSEQHEEVTEVAAPAEDSADERLEAVPEEAGEEEAEAVGPQDELDEQLLPIFFEEAEELTVGIGAALREMRAEPHAAEPQQALARLLHTLKGSARMAGAMRLGAFVHGIETRLDSAIKAQQVDAALAEELETGLDHIGMMLGAIGAPFAVPAHVDAHAPAKPAPAPESAKPAIGESAASWYTPPSLAVEEHDPLHAAAQRAALRVRADLVDRFVNEAGEISIARTRIEGEMRTLRRSLLDLTENVIRLRNQLREVEIQAESQMQSRIAAAEAKHAEFDPLEFDRFTRLQELTRMMAESVGDVTTIQQNLLRNIDSADSALHSQGRLSRDLQQALMSVRMVPFEDLADRLYRIVRQTAKELGKRANLDIQGGSIELDRGVLDRITAPIEHLLRNAVAHGIESPEARAAAGKSEFGQITLKLTQLSNEIALELSDDGNGLDYARILAHGREKGLVGADEQPSENRLTQLIFEPGFSTAEAVSGVAGRGVGMDVVKNETLAVGGRIDISTNAGQGTSFLIHLPLTLAVTQALLVRAGGRTYAIPSNMVEQAQELKEAALQEVITRGQAEWKGTVYPYTYLPRLLGDTHSRPAHTRFQWLLLIRGGSQTVAVHIDELRGNQEIVVKNAGPQFVRLSGFSGATVLPDGEISLILNPVQLAARLSSAAAAAPAVDTGEEVVEEIKETRIPTIMVVDDSLTVRKITSRLLEREGFRVVTAKDGVDALEQLVDFKPDVMLLDIEMPRMDGFDLARNVRADERLHDLPIIMITSRMADKHRNYAMEIGVNHYLGKPYQEEQLLELIASFIASKRH